MSVSQKSTDTVKVDDAKVSVFYRKRQVVVLSVTGLTASVFCKPIAKVNCLCSFFGATVVKRDFFLYHDRRSNRAVTDHYWHVATDVSDEAVSLPSNTLFVPYPVGWGPTPSLVIGCDRLHVVTPCFLFVERLLHTQLYLKSE